MVLEMKDSVCESLWLMKTRPTIDGAEEKALAGEIC